MYLVVIAWMYVAVMMSVAEASSSNGTLLGAIVTLVIYGIAPVALVVYLMGGPGRARRRKAREAQEWAQYNGDASSSPSYPPNAGSQAPTDPVAPMRKEP